MKRMKKIIAVLLSLILIAGFFLIFEWKNEISTIMSIKQIKDNNMEHDDGYSYTIRIKGDFYLDDFVEQGGVKNDEELIAFVTNKITKGLLKINIDEPEIACSSFTARGENDDKLFARNYDMKMTNTAVVITEKNKDRHASISSVDLGFLGIDKEKGISSLMDKITSIASVYAPLDGINDAGVACGIYMTYQGGEKTIPTDQNSDKPDFTSTTLLRMILDYADDLNEAVEIAKSYDLHDSANTSYHYMVADASGRSAILEWIAGDDSSDNDGSKRELIVTYNDKDAYIGEMEEQSDYQVVTNFIIQPGYYDNSPDLDKKGYDRYLKLNEELKKCDGIVEDEKQAMKILSSVSRRDWKNDDSNSITVHSVIYNLTQKTAMWVPNENYNDLDSIFYFDFK